MRKEDKHRIISNEYMDLLVDFNQNEEVFEKYIDGVPNIINIRFATVHIPSSQISRFSISQYGYSIFPACYGLTSEASLEKSGVRRIRNTPGFSLRGQGVVIGIVDTGIDYTNPIFRNADGSSRIISIWDQTVDSEDGYPLETFYGTEYLREQINEALTSEDPLSVVPTKDEIGHGTMLAGIAGGGEDEKNGFSGVAPNVEFIIVKLKQAKEIVRDFFRIPRDAICYQENDIMFGINYLIMKGRVELRKPMVVCVGLGSNQGSHAGAKSLGEAVSVYGNLPGIVFSVAAGNQGNARGHFYGTISPQVGYENVELNVGQNEPGFTMEIWGESPNIYSVDILSPTGEYIPRIPARLNENKEISFLFEETIINLDYQIVETRTGDQLILLRFRNPFPGIWRFRVYGEGDLERSFHVWLPLKNFIESDTYFIKPDPYTTVVSPGNTDAITTTAYNVENDSLYINASKGYSRSNRVVPVIAAPGVDLLAPNTSQGYERVTGTSVAAAHCSGVAAMLLEWGVVRGNYPGLDTVRVKNFMIRGARRSSELEYPNRDWGYGILDVFNIFDVLRRDELEQ